jgi:GNAT superfamily N-acetyltransferase
MGDAAIDQVERPLTAGLVEIKAVDPADRDAERCLHEYFAELDRRFVGGFDQRPIAADLDAFRHPAGLFLIATLRGEPIGCGGLRFHGDEPAEIKRVWVAESARGLGIGRRLLAELESRAASEGIAAVRLDTNAALSEAIGLYHSAGYREVDAFNDEPYAHHWFEKRLEPRTSTRENETA